MTLRQSKTLVIILHEIYGVNNHIHHYEKLLSKQGYAVLCPNLLHRDPFPYEREEEAYDYFMQSISFEKAVHEVSQLVEDYRSRYERIFLVGFSVGATVAWMCSGEAEVDGVVGFYGSRIRSYVEVEPGCRVQLFFSSQEKSLNVEELVTGLSEKRGTDIQIVEGRHGFMNPFHPAYDAVQAEKCMDRMLELLTNGGTEMMDFVKCSADNVEAELAIMNSNPAFNLVSKDKEELTLQEIIDDRSESVQIGAERFLIEVEHGYVGVIDWLMKNPNDGYPWLGLLTIKKEYQNHGYAKQALCQFYDLMRERGVTELRIGVIAMNKPAHRFWRAQGFEEVKSSEVGDKPILIYEKRI